MIAPQFVGLSVCTLLLGVILSYLFLKVRVTYVFKFILIPTTLVIVLMAISLFSDVLGYAKPDYPKGQFSLLYHKAHKEKGELKIHMLVHQKEHARYFDVPYSKELLEQLNEMARRQASGQGLVLGELEQGQNGMAARMTIKTVPYGSLIPKDTPVQ